MNAFVAIFCLAIASASAGWIGHGHDAHAYHAEAHIPSGSVSVGHNGAVIAGPSGSVHTDNGLHGHGASARLSGPAGEVGTHGGLAHLAGPGLEHHGHGHVAVVADHGYGHAAVIAAPAYGYAAHATHTAVVGPSSHATIVGPSSSAVVYAGHADHGYGHGYGHAALVAPAYGHAGIVSHGLVGHGHGLVGHGYGIVGHGHHGW